MNGEPWLDEDIELVKRLWAAGETAQAIADRLGSFSRSAVLGKIFRLRLETAEKPRAQAKRGGATLARRRTGKADPAPAKSARQGKTLHELTNRCCRWPYKRPGTERYFFCGAEEADLEGGIPYCARHMKRAYLVPPPAVVQTQRKSFKTFKAA